MISAVLFVSFFVFLIMGVPIAICLGLSSVCAILYSGTSLTIVATNMYAGISKFLLLAIPFFVLSGNIMAKAGISKRLVKFVDTCVGHRRGGIAIVFPVPARQLLQPLAQFWFRQWWKEAALAHHFLLR